MAQREYFSNAKINKYGIPKGYETEATQVDPT